jgi:hypothetical protein
MRHSSHHDRTDHSSPKFKLGEITRTDGLKYKLYKKFWSYLGPFQLHVANTSMQEGKLPTSKLNGVITLTPKKGDLTLPSNWKPIALLNTDYKIKACCLARRIISVLPDLITTKVTVYQIKPFTPTFISYETPETTPTSMICHLQSYPLIKPLHMTAWSTLTSSTYWKNLALARLLSKTYEMCTAMHKDKS